MEAAKSLKPKRGGSPAKKKPDPPPKKKGKGEVEEAPKPKEKTRDDVRVLSHLDQPSYDEKFEYMLG